MKNRTIRILLSILFIAVMGKTIFPQTITLTFTAQDANKNYVQLNRVVVTNLSRGWSETLIYPDTILIMENSIGIDEYEKSTAFTLFQNNPNPFEGVTDFTIQLPKQEMVYASVFDLNGKIVTSIQSQMSGGTHTFRVFLSTPSTYILNVRAGQSDASIKMVNTGFSSANQIDYLTTNKTDFIYELKAGKGETSNPFVFGDMMEYVGYATINGQEYESDRISRQQGSSQTYILNFSTVAQHYIPIIQTDTQVIIQNRHAVIGGAILDRGGTEIKEKGICYSLSNMPTYNSLKEISESKDDVFQLELSNLLTDTLYYARAFAMNSVGIAYGEVVHFKVLSSKPVVKTIGVDRVYNKSVIIRGKIEDDGGVPILNKGFSWSLTSNPSIEDTSIIYNEDSVSEFTNTIDGLSEGTTYYVRAFAANARGVSYGENIIFTTLKDSIEKPKTLPTVITADITNITASSAICGGEVISDGGADIIACGVCWSINNNPTIGDNLTIEEFETNNFTSSLTNLDITTTYYVRAYATNSVGTAYGEEISFTTTSYYEWDGIGRNPNDGKPCQSGATVTDRDGNKYNTVQIGEQCWMKENLRVTKWNTNSQITLGTQYQSSTSVCFRYQNGNVNENGYLYNRTVASRGTICPTGWHVPNSAQWEKLANYVGNQTDYICDTISTNNAKALASTTTWKSSTNTCSVGNTLSNNNATGFSAVPVGYYNGGGFSQQGEVARFWTSGATMQSYQISYNKSNMEQWTKNQQYYGLSIRCLKD